jgi:hypothetical protein
VACAIAFGAAGEFEALLFIRIGDSLRAKITENITMSNSIARNGRLLFGAGLVTLLAAAPLSLQWSPAKTLSLSVDRANAQIGNPASPRSIAGVHRRTYRRTAPRPYAAAALGAAGAFGTFGTYYANNGYYGNGYDESAYYDSGYPANNASTYYAPRRPYAAAALGARAFGTFPYYGNALYSYRPLARAALYNSATNASGYYGNGYDESAYYASGYPGANTSTYYAPRRPYAAAALGARAFGTSPYYGSGNNNLYSYAPGASTATTHEAAPAQAYGRAMNDGGFLQASTTGATIPEDLYAACVERNFGTCPSQ